ncbi:hypothetical protein FNU76_21255 [Chitinimonas arctica]|uniref:Uncharacterized protein n=1 Tax=Chitinimonas arctica TaxID=2594795 RepID=A0A516SKK0_9NEIS|nr:hypothetical protein [Chitinimonas arctica]QDQ28680.1 hypothetical protein FNU76_21255 [Chitinimonas arctica]
MSVGSMFASAASFTRNLLVQDKSNDTQRNGEAEGTFGSSVISLANNVQDRMLGGVEALGKTFISAVRNNMTEPVSGKIADAGGKIVKTAGEVSEALRPRIQSVSESPVGSAAKELFNKADRTTRALTTSLLPTGRALADSKSEQRAASMKRESMGPSRVRNDNVERRSTSMSTSVESTSLNPGVEECEFIQDLEEVPQSSDNQLYAKLSDSRRGLFDALEEMQALVDKSYGSKPSISGPSEQSAPKLDGAVASPDVLVPEKPSWKKGDAWSDVLLEALGEPGEINVPPDKPVDIDSLINEMSNRYGPGLGNSVASRGSSAPTEPSQTNGGTSLNSDMGARNAEWNSKWGDVIALLTPEDNIMNKEG